MRKSIFYLLLFMTITVRTNAGALIVRPSADSVYICQSKTAYAYHSYECRGLARCTHAIAKITKAQAIRLGYKACKICYR